ncbi:MAG TPA: DUF1854 domain-containing protein [Luteolibacter sp.]|nr:DUF1854 domain-containing protein [Luteolibacter sp.]
MADPFQLQRDSFGRLVFTGADGGVHVGVEPARAFPISAPDEHIALLGRNGQELAWISRLEELAPETRKLIGQALEAREFMPEIQSITGVSGYATPCTWQIETDRGPTSLILNAEEDIRRLSASCLLIIDSRGIQFLIRDRRALNETSRRILERFL